MFARQGSQTLAKCMRLLPSMADGQQTRNVQLFEIFSKAARAERRKQLMSETARGYFDDFREFRDSKGKVFFCPDRLIPATEAANFPQMNDTLLPSGDPSPFPPLDPSAAALVCIAFRAGAQEMLEAWAKHFSTAFQANANVAVYELALVESPVMKLWPFKSMILRAGSQNADKYALPATYLFWFGDTKDVRPPLYMTNRLTGYVYLVDREGRIRWRGSGNPDAKELEVLVSCTEQLVNEQ